jgi:hypothetical protein
MERSDLNKILRKNFTKYSDREYSEYLYKPRKANWYYSKEFDGFHLIVFNDDDSVYQLGTEANTIGIELKTVAALKRRYNSFTGEKLKI